MKKTPKRKTSSTGTSKNNSSRRKQTSPVKRPATTLMYISGKKFKISNKTLHEIQSLQHSTALQIPKLSFAKLAREIFLEYGPRDLRIQLLALEALQTAAEMYMVDFFEDSYLCTIHARRVTLLARDMKLAKQIRKET